MLKRRYASALWAVLLFLTGCAGKAKDDFADYSVTEYPPIEYLSAETEFPEYDGSTEGLCVFLTNDRDEDFHFDCEWRLDKDVDGEWRAIRFIKDREIKLVDYYMQRDTVPIWCDLKKYVRLPLIPGHYRIWVGGSGQRVPAEFDIK